MSKTGNRDSTGNSTETEYKNRLANVQMKTTLAIGSPGLFSKKFILNLEKGDVERMRMVFLNGV